MFVWEINDVLCVCVVNVVGHVSEFCHVNETTEPALFRWFYKCNRSCLPTPTGFEPIARLHAKSLRNILILPLDACVLVV